MKNEKGFTLIEVLVSLALLGIIGSAFLGSLGTASNAIFVADEQATAESLARSQMEDIKKQAYDAIHEPPQYNILDAEDYEFDYEEAGYEIVVAAERLDPEGDGTWNEEFDIPDDDGIQKITVIINHNGGEVITLEDYKVNR